MKRHGTRKGIAPATLLMALAIAGCGDGGVTGLGESFDPGVTANLIRDVVKSEYNVATAHVWRAASAVRGYTTPAEAAVPRLRAAARGWLRHSGSGAGVGAEPLSPTEIRGLALSLGGESSSALLASEILGATFVLRQNSGGYVVAEGREGAPSDGGRFLLYELDPVTGQPKLIPRSEAGHMDVIDMGVTGPAGIAVRAVDKGDNPLADYSITGTFSSDETGLAYRVESSGSVDGHVNADFWVLDDVAFTDGFTRAVFEFSRTFDVEGRGLQVSQTMLGDITSDPENPGQLTITLTVSSGGHSAVLTLTDDGTTVTGDVTYDGQVAMLVSGDNFDPIFSTPDGTAVQGRELDRMWDIWFEIDDLLAYGDTMLAPFSFLFD